jgi:HTH-type transcriptional regulator / antitoxin HigA
MERRTPVEVFPPGEFIREELEARGWTQEVLAEIIGRSPRLVNEIIAGKRSITPETAHGLADAFGTGPQLWMNLESAYRLQQSQPKDDLVARRARLYGKVPVREMIRRRWVEKSDNVDVLEGRVLAFLGLRSVEDALRPIPHAARKSASDEAANPAQHVWLLRARQLAPAVSARPFTAARLQESLSKLRLLLQNPEEVRQVPRILSEAGVRLVIVEHLPQTKIDGCTFWLDARSPVVALSLRYGRIDAFWYTLHHELRHVLNGDVRIAGAALLDSDIYGEGAIPFAERDEMEQRANREAAETLIPKAELDDFIARTSPLYAKTKIIGFANLIRVHPGIVVGQLQNRREILFSHSREMLVPVREKVTSATLTDGWGHHPPLLTTAQG